MSLCRGPKRTWLLEAGELRYPGQLNLWSQSQSCLFRFGFAWALAYEQPLRYSVPKTCLGDATISQTFTAHLSGLHWTSGKDKNKSSAFLARSCSASALFNSFPQPPRTSILHACPVQMINGGAALQPVRLAAFWALATTHLSSSSRTRG